MKRTHSAYKVQKISWISELGLGISKGKCKLLKIDNFESNFDADYWLKFAKTIKVGRMN